MYRYNIIAIASGVHYSVYMVHSKVSICCISILLRNLWCSGIYMLSYFMVNKSRINTGNDIILFLIIIYNMCMINFSNIISVAL